MILVNTKERILQYLNYKGVTKSIFYTEIGIKRGLLDSDKMNSTVSDTVIAKIIVTYKDINPDWLLTGEGEMLRTLSPPNEDSTSSALVKELLATIENKSEEIGGLKQKIKQLEKEIANLNDKSRSADSHMECAG